MGQSTTTVVGYQVGKPAVPKISLHRSCKWLQQFGVVEVQRTSVATGVSGKPDDPLKRVPSRRSNTPSRFDPLGQPNKTPCGLLPSCLLQVTRGRPTTLFPTGLIFSSSGQAFARSWRAGKALWQVLLHRDHGGSFGRLSQLVVIPRLSSRWALLSTQVTPPSPLVVFGRFARELTEAAARGY